MDALRQLLVLNRNNLDRLRVRSMSCRARLRTTEADTRTLYGPYASYWDEWYAEAEAIVADLRSDIAATAHFATELRDFIVLAESPESELKVTKRRITAMHKIALEAVSCQKDMISITDQRLTDLRAFTHKLLLVEAIDSLDD